MAPSPDVPSTADKRARNRSEASGRGCTLMYFCRARLAAEVLPGTPGTTMSTTAPNLHRPAVKVFVATTVMLTFISFWRAAAIVLSDLASSAYYVGGDAEKVI